MKEQLCCHRTANDKSVLFEIKLSALGKSLPTCGRLTAVRTFVRKYRKNFSRGRRTDRMETLVQVDRARSAFNYQNVIFTRQWDRSMPPVLRLSGRRDSGLSGRAFVRLCDTARLGEIRAPNQQPDQRPSGAIHISNEPAVEYPDDGSREHRQHRMAGRLNILRHQ